MAIVETSYRIGKPVARPDLRLRLDRSLFSHSLILRSLQIEGALEYATSEFVVEVLRPGDVFVDIGAHIGWYTVLAGRLVEPSGQVYAFEPERSNYERLVEHLRLNDSRNVLPYHWAVGRCSGPAELFVNPENDGGHALWDLRQVPEMLKQPEKVEKRPVFTITLDEMFAAMSPGYIRAIKMDTEGTETDILDGGHETLKRLNVPAVICEINRMLCTSFGASEAAIHERMRGLGYSVYADHPTHPRLVRLDRGFTLDTTDVFNVIYVRPELERELHILQEAERGPQCPL